ncbi:MAG: universal stress protein [Microthrixaceae bacterium]
MNEGNRPVVLGYDDSDPSRAAVPVAVELARALGADLVVAFGYEPPRSGGEVGALRDEIEKVGEELAAEAVAAAHAIDPGLPVRVELVQDRPAEAVVRVADDLDARLIVLGHRQMSLLAEVFVGSVLESVMAATVRPVVVVQAED